MAEGPKSLYSTKIHHLESGLALTERVKSVVCCTFSWRRFGETESSKDHTEVIFAKSQGQKVLDCYTQIKINHLQVAPASWKRVRTVVFCAFARCRFRNAGLPEKRCIFFTFSFFFVRRTNILAFYQMLRFFS